MTGTHYILDRDRPENQNPMVLAKEKACSRCGTVKPNNFQFFGKKLWKTRHDLTTTGVCIACKQKKVSDSMVAKWKVRKGKVGDYQAEQLRMARTIYEANEAVRVKAERAAQEDAERNPGVLRLDPVEALNVDEAVVVTPVEPMATDQSQGRQGESASEALMRELLGKT